MITQGFKFKPRHYLHFDRPVSRVAAETLACDPDQVAKHSFLPLLGYTMVTPRIKRDAQGTIEVRPKCRDIRLAAHRDAAIYSHYSDILTRVYEEEVDRLALNRVITAFRSVPNGGTNIDYAGEVFRYIDSHRPCVALAFDVKEFFDTLDHQLLKERWCRVLGVERLPEDHFALFKNLTEYCWAPREDVYRVFGISRHNPKANRRRQICSPKAFRNSVRGGGLLKFNPKKGKGIPQGAPISALLSNIYMLDFDRKVSEEIKRLGGIYRRYCDDIMIVVPPGSREEAERLVHEEVQAVRLELNGKKTDRVVYEGEPGQPAEIPKNESGFSTVIQYLGFTFDGSKILIRLGSLARYYSKMRAGVSLAKQTQRKQNRKEADQGLPASRLRTRKLYLRYSYLFDRRKGKGRREQNAQGNFLTYAYEAARKLRSPAIKKQVRRHWKKLQSEINK